MATLPPFSARLPWLEPALDALERAVAQDRLPHAVLLQVGAGLGGDWLARWLAARMYCDRVCGDCLSCRRVHAGEHPDLQLLSPEDSSEIRIEQVRALGEQFSLTRHGDGRKVAIIAPADRLNRNAANALLKTLEEPSGESLIILVTAHGSRLPATIVSRCMRLGLSPPATSVLVAWLQREYADRHAALDWAAVLEILGPAPLAVSEVDVVQLLAIRQAARQAVREAQAGRLDPAVTAERWGKEQFGWYLTALTRCAEDALRQHALRAHAATDQAPRDHALQGDRRASQYWLGLLDELLEARRWEESPINKTLLMQRLLWRLSAAKTIPDRV